MRSTFALLGVMWLAAAGTAEADLPFGLTQGLTLTHDGELRTYAVMRPTGVADAVPAPLVVDLHGFTSNGAQQRAISGWVGLSSQEGFLVAWPEGLGNSWNAVTCCGSAVANDVDDVGFIRAMVAAIQAEVNVDAGRVYVTGLSNGGAMTHRLACEAADIFAAAAPMAFGIPYPSFATQCTPSRLVPILLTMGLTDVLVPYATAAPSFAGWRDKNGCDSGGAAVEIDETYGGSDCAIDTSCGSAGIEVGLCSVTGSAFPPPLNIFSGHILYINDDAFDITQRSWDFMSRYSIPPLAIPALGAPFLLIGALAATGAAFLYRRRRKDVG
jgi:polyhydroxybutyrate depolymerase